MKRITTLIAVLLLGGITAYGSSIMPMGNFWGYDYNRSYIFVEGGVEFAVYPDGQFDFAFVGGNRGRVNVDYYNNGLNISFNSGYNYDLYVQYDDYGAVIQVENVPIFYDYYGRITRAGNVDIHYNNRRIVRVGGMHIYYDRWGYFSYFTGYVSPWYRYYVYRPWHVYYARPFYNNCIVYDYPYRRFYNPHRYDYNYHRRNYNRRGRSSYANGRRSFHRPGSRIHYENGRVARNKDYRKDRENTMIDTRTRPARENVQSNSRPVASSETGRDRGNRKNRPQADTRVDRREQSNARTRPVARVENDRSQRTKPAINSRSDRTTVNKNGSKARSNSNRSGRMTTVTNKRSGSNSKARVTNNRSTRNNNARVSSRSDSRSKGSKNSNVRSSRSGERQSSGSRNSRSKKL